MAKLVFGLNQSLDGYVDHMAFAPSPTLFRHFIEQVRDQAGSVYGRRLYEALLGRGLSRVGRGGTRLRGGVAEATQVGRVALVEVGRTQRHTPSGMASRR